MVLNLGKDKTEIIKPKKDGKVSKNVLTPIIYLILGVILAFKSDEAVKLVFYILGIIVIIYGIKSLITYYQNKDNMQFKNINLSIGVISILIGALLIILAGALNLGIRYILGFFMIFIGVSRLLSDYSLSNYKNFNTMSNIVLIILGIFSIFVSNAVLVIIGWILIVNSALLFFEYFKN